MKESFLHFLWQYGLFDTSNLKTTEGQTIEIEGRGVHNRNSGPDFSEARLSINGTAWAGHVEIHVYASEWYQHGHQFDSAYDPTVLHVVYRCDRPVFRTDGSPIPCLELHNRIPAGYINRWEELSRNMSAVPCSIHNPSRYESAVLGMKHRALAERMLQKAARVISMAGDTINDWEEVLYRLIARYLGHKVNTEAMEMLATSMPLKTLRKHADNLQQMEALLFGQAGFLAGKPRDKYMKSLKSEYAYLAHKYSLNPMQPSVWKFGRLRPCNFPTVRIAQLAALLHQSGSHLYRFLQLMSASDARNMLDITASDYWNTRYSFSASGRNQPKRIGDDTVNGLLVNAVFPAMFAYSRHRGEIGQTDLVFDMLAELPPESNFITRYWQSLDFENSNAYDSQALLGLKSMYCDRRLCLNCSIGQKILRTDEPEDNLPLFSCVQEVNLQV